MYAKYVELRDARSLTDAKVSEATGISRSTFTDWKNGRSTPKIEKIIKLAEFFDISVDEFVRQTK